MKSGHGLPVSIDPLRFVDSNRELSGTIALSAMPRLQGALASEDGWVKVDLRFYRDNYHRPVIDGSIDAGVSMICQRCMHGFVLQLQLPVALGIVQTDEQADNLADDRDPLLLDEDSIRVSELVEDELILGLPTIAMHPEGDPGCIVTRGTRDVQAGKVAGTGKSKETRDCGTQVTSRDENPFAVLSTLKTRADTDKD